jgi:hypothetical protein
MSAFVQVGDANLLAYKNHHEQTELVAKKQEILDAVATVHNLNPVNMLFVGFSSFLFGKFSKQIAVTDLSTDAQSYLTAQKINFKYIPRSELGLYRKKFQAVVAVDEYFTYADSDNEQRDQVIEICNLATDYVITTVRDYKNQDYKDREFSMPLLSRGNNHTIFLESHEWDSTDRNKWNSMIYAISQADNRLTTFGSFNRHTMYFKQLANFSSAAGATNFLVHKNLMYKGLVKKNYEHVISIKFD